MRIVRLSLGVNGKGQSGEERENDRIRGGLREWRDCCVNGWAPLAAGGDEDTVTQCGTDGLFEGRVRQ